MLGVLRRAVGRVTLGQRQSVCGSVWHRDKATWTHVADLPGKAGPQSAVRMGDGRVLVLSSGARGFVDAEGQSWRDAVVEGSLSGTNKAIAAVGNRAFIGGKSLREHMAVAEVEGEQVRVQAAKQLQPPYQSYGLVSVAERLLAVGWGYLEEVSGEGCAVRAAVDAHAQVEQLAWEEAAVIGTPTGEPPRAAGAVSVVVAPAEAGGTSERVFSFAANEDGTGLEVAVLDTASMLWSRPLVGGTDPGALTHFSAAMVGRKVVIYGGLHFAEHLICRHSNTDLYTFDVDTFEWEKLQSEGDVPANRYNHSAVGLSDKSMLVVGGNNEIRSLKDIYRLDFD